MTRSSRLRPLVAVLAALRRPRRGRRLRPARGRSRRPRSASRCSRTRPSGVSTCSSTGSRSRPTSGPSALAKPVLFPIRTAAGTLVTRGFPLDPRPGERVDHPHHVGLWFNHGDVNGVDFWNNSEAQKPEERAKMGTIRHVAIEAAKGGAGRGELKTASDWILPDGSTAIHEKTGYVFGAAAGTPLDRPRDDADGRRQARRLHGQQGGDAGAARRARARGALEGAARVHRREREADRRAGARQRGRERPLHQQRGPDGRRGLGHARALGRARRQGRAGGRRAADPRPPEEPGLPDLLARARLRPLRGEPARREGAQQRQGAAEPGARAGPEPRASATAC